MAEAYLKKFAHDKYDVESAGLEPVDQTNPLVVAAMHERVDLGARGCYSTPQLNFDSERGRGRPFLYYTSGGAVSEVLVERFTGGNLFCPRCR